MRSSITAAIVLAYCLACGGSSSGSGSTGPGQARLHISVAGSGTVRGAGSDCRGNCDLTPAPGTQYQLEAVPDSGGTFAGWSGACTGTGACQITVNGDVSVLASFTGAGGSHLLTVVVEGQGQGRVVSSPPGIDCPAAACSAAFAAGTAVSLSATAAAGSSFTGWGAGCSGAGACNVSLGSDAQVFAHFGVAQVTLSVAVSGPGEASGGMILCGDAFGVCSAKVAQGTSVTLTAVPVQSARFMGWGGACSGTGSCQLVVQSDTAVTAAFEFELTTLAVNDGTNIFALALNSTSVFFPRRTFDGMGIWSVPKAGGTAVRVATGSASFIVADDSFVYWTDGIAIYSAPATGGSGALLATGNVGRMALDDQGALYWINMRDFGGGKGSIHRMANRVDAVIASGQNQNLGVAVDSTDAYFTCSSTDGLDKAIRRVPKKGGTVETVVTTSVQPLAVRVDSKNVYFRDLSSAVWSASKSGGTARQLSALNGSNGFLSSAELDVNASVVWWIWGDGTAGPKGLFRAGADGSGFTAVDTGSDFNWFGPRVDDTAVYYFHAGALLKRLK
jgi:Divergent InlB B-repeat domain